MSEDARRRPVQREWTAQRADATFLSKALPIDAYFTAIDVGRSRSAHEGQLRKLRGVKSGVPDFLIVYRGVTLWIERKAGQSLSPAQKITRDALIANGHRWALARSTEDIESALCESGIPLRATLGDIRTRIAEQNERLPAKRKRAVRRQSSATPSMSVAQYHKMHAKGHV